MIMFSRGKIDLDEKQKLLEDSLKVSPTESEIWIPSFLIVFKTIRSIFRCVDSETSLSENQFGRHLFTIFGCWILHRIVRIMFVMR